MSNEFEDSFDATVDFKKLFATLQGWAWLLIFVTILSMVSAYVYSRLQTPVYEATTNILVTRNLQQTVGDFSQTLSLSELVQTYVRRLSLDEFLEIVSRRVGYKVESKNVDVSALTNTQIIQLKVRDVNPARAALIADTMVIILGEQNETLQASRYTDAEQSLNIQIKDIEVSLADIQAKLDKAKSSVYIEQTNQAQANIDATVNAIKAVTLELEKLNTPLETKQGLSSALVEKESFLKTQQSLLTAYQTEYADLLSTKQVSRTTNEIDDLQRNLDLYQNIHLNLLSSREDIKKQKLQKIPTIEQISPALTSEDPVKPRTLLNTLLGGLAGLILALGFVMLRDMTDDTHRQGPRRS